MVPAHSRCLINICRLTGRVCCLIESGLPEIHSPHSAGCRLGWSHWAGSRQVQHGGNCQQLSKCCTASASFCGTQVVPCPPLSWHHQPVSLYLICAGWWQHTGILICIIAFPYVCCHIDMASILEWVTYPNTRGSS